MFAKMPHVIHLLSYYLTRKQVSNLNMSRWRRVAPASRSQRVTKIGQISINQAMYHNIWFMITTLCED